MDKGLLELIKLGTTITLTSLCLNATGCTGIRQYGISGYVGRECLLGYEEDYQRIQAEQDSRSK